MITVQEAEQLVFANVCGWGDETVPLYAAQGRILLDDIAADRNYPPYHRVTMDGIAIASSAWLKGLRRFRVESVVQAGASIATLRDTANGCLEIMTGAVLPSGCDTIIPYEQVRLENGSAIIAEDVTATAGQFVHREGSDRAKGDILIRRGVRIAPNHVAVIASTGQAQVRVSRLPRVTIVSTGDEIVDVGAPVETHQIRPSNAYGIAAAFRALGCEAVEVPIVGDHRDEIFQTLEKELKQSDILVLSGGVSMGKADYVPASLDALGSKLIFHKVSQKPGRPMWFGVAPGGKPVFALPGNPVSSMVCFYRYALPAIQRALGLASQPEEWAVLAEDVRSEMNLTMFRQVTIRSERDGRLVVTTDTYGGSGDIASLGASEGFVELPLGREKAPAGEVVRLHRWRV